MEKLKYFLKEGFRSIWVNRMMSLASVLVLGICLLMMGTTLLVSMNIDKLMTQLISKDQIMVFIKSDTSADAISQLGSSIQALPNVSGCTFLSRDEIFNQAKEELGSQNILLSGIDSSAFDSAYQVKINNISDYTATVNAINKMTGVKFVRQDSELADTLSKIRNAVYFAGLWLFAIMAVISLFLISNTVKLAMFNRKREINIMKYVGATDWFIRWPFIIEGVIIGLIASSAALLAQWLIYRNFIINVLSVFNLAQPLRFGSIANFIVPGFLLAGLFFGVLGGVVSVRKYLKV
jgi:cell division transport system permease protein